MTGERAGRFHDFTVDEAIEIGRRNDPGENVPSVSRTLIAEIERLRSSIEHQAVAGEAVPHVSLDCRDWFYYPIAMPLTKNGYGPADYRSTDRVAYEVWDQSLNSFSTHESLCDAINEAMRLESMRNALAAKQQESEGAMRAAKSRETASPEANAATEALISELQQQEMRG